VGGRPILFGISLNPQWVWDFKIHSENEFFDGLPAANRVLVDLGLFLRANVGPLGARLYFNGGPVPINKGGDTRNLVMGLDFLIPLQRNIYSSK